jgi:hypothetical protein
MLTYTLSFASLIYLTAFGAILELNLVPKTPNQPATTPYAATGHPSIEQLMTEQGTSPITDPSVLRGDFWPEEESVEEFLETLRDWRGHRRTDPAA